MYRLLQLLHTYRAFLLLIFIEIVCLWLMVRNNPYHSAAYFHSSNALVSTIFNTRKNITQYFNLPLVNLELANDNARLREQLAKNQLPIIVDSSRDSLERTDPNFAYSYIAGKVINNSTNFIHNYITINKGSINGVKPNMGVISANGVIGKVMSVSKNFATVASLLNADVYVSAFIQRNNTFGSIHWDGSSITQTKLMYVPKHIILQKGDTIVTSGYNSIYPEGITIGYIDEFELNENGYFDIDVNLSNDFSNLGYVYIVKNPLKDERIELEAAIKQENE